MAAALLVLDLRGETVNLMIVAGLLIALAILVDDAVACTRTIADRVHADREAGRETPAHTLVLEAAVEARRGIIYATLIALLPLLRGRRPGRRRAARAFAAARRPGLAGRLGDGDPGALDAAAHPRHVERRRRLAAPRTSARALHAAPRAGSP